MKGWERRKNAIKKARNKFVKVLQKLFNMKKAINITHSIIYFLNLMIAIDRQNYLIIQFYFFIKIILGKIEI